MQPWINGPIELLNHGFKHLQEGNDFDLRIGMISIDNALEVGIKTYLTLNRRQLEIEPIAFYAIGIEWPIAFYQVMKMYSEQ